MAASADPKQLSPKVKASAYTTLWLSLLGVVVAAVTTWVGGVTPEQAPFLGVWFVPVVTAVTGVLNTLSGYLKSDPLRDNYAAQALAAEKSKQEQVDLRFGNNAG